MKRIKKAFTLVELIVVVTILAILGTIAFISFQSYTKNARDGKRISDLSNIKKNLELFIIEKGFYPTPDGGVNITYSGAIVRTQGIVGNNLTINLKRLDKKPTDPLTENEYAYSVTNTRGEFEVGAMLEGGGLLLGGVVPKANAAILNKTNAMVTGTYNGKILKVSTGSVDYILAIPTIINGDINNIDLLEVINNKSMVYNSYQNLPDSYKDKGYSMTGGFDFVPGGDIVVYSGSISNLGQDSDKLIFIDNLKGVYNGTILQGDENYKDIIEVDTINNQPQAISLVNDYIKNNIGGLKGVGISDSGGGGGGGNLLTIGNEPSLNNLYSFSGYTAHDNSSIFEGTLISRMYDAQYFVPGLVVEVEIQPGETPPSLSNLIDSTVTIETSPTLTQLDIIDGEVQDGGDGYYMLVLNLELIPTEITPGQYNLSWNIPGYETLTSTVNVYGIWSITGNPLAYSIAESISYPDSWEIQLDSQVMNSCQLIGVNVAVHGCYNIQGYNRMDFLKYENSSWQYVYPFIDIALQDINYNLQSGRFVLTCLNDPPASSIPQPDVFVLSSDTNCSSYESGVLPN
nr:prepilin-type N-terminal cleavage/methylation domain-containing protein [Candidatus Gracilibacteria bacterium]